MPARPSASPALSGDRPKSRRRRQCDDERRHHDEELAKAQDHRFAPAAKDGGGGAQQGAKQKAYCTDREDDAGRPPPAGHDPGQKIATEMIGTEQMAGAHAGMTGKHVHRIGIIWLPKAAGTETNGERREHDQPGHQARRGSRRRMARLAPAFITSIQMAMTMT
jgi:hypothetical protein